MPRNQGGGAGVHASIEAKECQGLPTCQKLRERHGTHSHKEPSRKTLRFLDFQPPEL